MRALKATILVLALPLMCTADVPLKKPNWQTFASVFRPEKSITVKQELSYAQAQSYVKVLQFPEDPDTLRKIAGFYFHLGNYNEGARWYRRALQVQPGDAQVTAWYAECLHHAGSPKAALLVLEALAEQKQETPVTAVLRAEVYYVTEKKEACKKLLTQLYNDLEKLKEDPGMALLRQHVAHNLGVINLTE